MCPLCRGGLGRDAHRKQLEYDRGLWVVLQDNYRLATGRGVILLQAALL